MSENKLCPVALDKIKQTIPKLREITSILNPLKIRFAYMIIFQAKYYYILLDNFAFIKAFADKIFHGCIFCDKDITGFCDGEYHFTVWPKLPTNQNMQLYFDHGIWNGLTISKFDDNYIELWGFIGAELEDTQDYLIHNKKLLLNFVSYFDNIKATLHVPKSCIKENLLCLPGGFDANIPSLVNVDNAARKLMQHINTCELYLDANGRLIKITSKERLVCATLSKVFSIKQTARELDVSVDTIKTHIQSLKNKLGAYSKSDLLYFCAKHNLCL